MLIQDYFEGQLCHLETSKGNFSHFPLVGVKLALTQPVEPYLEGPQQGF